VSARCEVCGRFKEPDGILMCRHCRDDGPRFRQDATVRPATIGDPSTRTTSTVRARVSRPGQRHTTVDQDTGVIYRDRGRPETKTLVVDRQRGRLRESWTHPESGEEHVKDVPLSGDPELHGAAGSKHFRARQRRPLDDRD
jgi:hypothetical protein